MKKLFTVLITLILVTTFCFNVFANFDIRFKKYINPDKIAYDEGCLPYFSSYFLNEDYNTYMNLGMEWEESPILRKNINTTYTENWVIINYDIIFECRQYSGSQVTDNMSGERNILKYPMIAYSPNPNPIKSFDTEEKQIFPGIQYLSSSNSHTEFALIIDKENDNTTLKRFNLQITNPASNDTTIYGTYETGALYHYEKDNVDNTYNNPVPEDFKLYGYTFFDKGYQTLETDLYNTIHNNIDLDSYLNQYAAEHSTENIIFESEQPVITKNNPYTTNPYDPNFLIVRLQGKVKYKKDNNGNIIEPNSTILHFYSPTMLVTNRYEEIQMEENSLTPDDFSENDYSKVGDYTVTLGGIQGNAYIDLANYLVCNHNTDTIIQDGPTGHHYVCSNCGFATNIEAHNGDPCTICNYTNQVSTRIDSGSYSGGGSSNDSIERIPKIDQQIYAQDDLLYKKVILNENIEEDNPIINNNNIGWTKIPNTNKWVYQDNYGLISGWKYVNGAYEGWYYFNNEKIMETNKWIPFSTDYYYLGSDGKMLINTTTPDGYKVDNEGKWIK